MHSALFSSASVSAGSPSRHASPSEKQKRGSSASRKSKNGAKGKVKGGLKKWGGKEYVTMEKTDQTDNAKNLELQVVSV